MILNLTNMFAHALAPSPAEPAKPPAVKSRDHYVHLRDYAPAILAAVEDGWVSTNSVAQRTGTGLHITYQRLGHMEKRGMVEAIREGAGRSRKVMWRKRKHA